MFKKWHVLIFAQLVLLVWLGGVQLRGQSGIYDRVGIVPGHGAFGSLSEENIDLFTGNVTLSYRDVICPAPTVWTSRYGAFTIRRSSRTASPATPSSKPIINPG